MNADMDFEQLYNTYFMQVYSFVMTLSKNQDISEEITQRTFFRALTTGKKYTGESTQLTCCVQLQKTC